MKCLQFGIGKLLPLTVALILRVQIAPNGHIGAQESELLGQCNAVHVTLSIAVRAVHASAIFVPHYGHVVREGRVRNAGLVEHLNRNRRFGKTQRGTIEQRFLRGTIVPRELVKKVQNLLDRKRVGSGKEWTVSDNKGR